MRVRKRSTRFFPLPNNVVDGPKFGFTLRTVPNSLAAKIVSDAITESYDRPVTKEARDRFKDADTIKVEQKTRADLAYVAQNKAAVVSFLFPGEDGDALDSEKMTDAQVEETIDMLDEELEYYLAQAVDIMQGSLPDEKETKKLAAMDVTIEMLGLSQAEVEFPVEDPTIGGGDA